ncbi:MAG: S1 RNA-binding domain-containing protein, partial [Ruminococcus sp.]|nr:S1 RNA-binding domain-containing protein [Ruminococcus sp.]
FIDLPESKTGMVHISEVAPTFITEISDYVKVGQIVKVKVLAVNDGKISLSLKQALPREQQKSRKSKNSSSAAKTASPTSLRRRSSRPVTTSGRARARRRPPALRT